MKDIIQSSFKQLLSHRHLLIVLIVLSILTGAFIVFVLLTVHPNELRVVTHYSAYGVTHFYRDQWLYLLGYAVFAFLVWLIHVGLAVKLLVVKGETPALFFAWLGVAVIVLAWLYELRIVEFS